MDTLIDTARKRYGYVSSAQVTDAGIPRRLITEAVEAGLLVRVDRGLYTLPET